MHSRRSLSAVGLWHFPMCLLAFLLMAACMGAGAAASDSGQPRDSSRDKATLPNAPDNHTFLWSGGWNATGIAQPTLTHDGIEVADSGDQGDNQSSLLQGVLDALVANLAGAKEGEAPWASFGNGPQHTFRSRYLGPENPGIAWAYGPAACYSPAIGADGTIYVGSSDNNVYALDGATGQPKWAYGTAGPVLSTPAIGAHGTIYVGSDDNKLYALDGETGRLRWEYAMDGGVRSSPAIGTDGTIYVGSDDNRLYALDAETGQLRWEYATDWYVRSSPAIGADGTVYVGSYDCKIYALDGATGQLKWMDWHVGNVVSSPVIGADGTVFAGSSSGKVSALDGSTGQLIPICSQSELMVQYGHGGKQPWPNRRN